MVLVAELYGLWAGDLGLGYVGRALDDQQKPEQHRNEDDGAEDTHPGDGIGARMKDLRHSRTESWRVRR
jgi:hypothetical protein